MAIELAPDDGGQYAYAIEVRRTLLNFGFGKLELDVVSGSTVSANVRMAEWVGAEVVAIHPASSTGMSEPG